MQFHETMVKEGSSTENNATFQDKYRHALSVVSLRQLRAGGF